MLPLAHRITATIAYADVFGYPLTDDELRYWLIGGGSGRFGTYTGISKYEINGVRYHFLDGRRQLVGLRLKRREIARKKWMRVRTYAGLFRIIPTILLTGVTGGLAMDNTDTSDDIDMFFIVRPGTIWVSRACVTILATVLGIRRTPRQRNVEDAFCLNMFMSLDSLTLPDPEHDLFAAHEVLQMKPVWERNGAYLRFLEKNGWVRTYLPNAWTGRRKSVRTHMPYRESVSTGFIERVMRRVEPAARFLQLRYMQTRRTSEAISPGSLRFHPHDARIWVYENFRKRMKKLNVPLDNIFFHS